MGSIFSWFKSHYKKWYILILFFGFVIVTSSLLYINFAFPETRCEAVKHLKAPDKLADCYECHKKATPKIAQDWFESKHGVMLVKCFVCHGQPDGKGSVPFAVNPDVKMTCRKCHGPSIENMQRKYGLDLECNSCHPFHHNSLHHKAYVKPKAKKSLD